MAKIKKPELYIGISDRATEIASQIEAIIHPKSWPKVASGATIFASENSSFCSKIFESEEAAHYVARFVKYFWGCKKSNLGCLATEFIRSYEFPQRDL